MTIKQRQALLFYLGYYNGNIDGDWGNRSREACENFQREFFQMESKVDGICGNETEQALKHAVTYGMPAKKGATDKNVGGKTGTFWDEIKYFERSEFRCTCGGKYCNGFPVEPDEQLVRILDKVREKYGKAFSPNSSIRCKKRNAEVGGVSNSQHLDGIAADISVPGVAPKTVAAYLETLLPNTGGIGIYSWGVHVDTRKTKSRWNG